MNDICDYCGAALVDGYCINCEELLKHLDIALEEVRSVVKLSKGGSTAIHSAYKVQQLIKRMVARAAPAISGDAGQHS